MAGTSSSTGGDDCAPTDPNCGGGGGVCPGLGGWGCDAPECEDTRVWGEVAIIDANWEEARYPDVAVGPDGTAIVVWTEVSDVSVDIWANRYVPGEGWGTAMLLEQDDAGDAKYARVAMDDAGNALAVWMQSDGTHDHAWANRYVPGQGWGTAQRIDDNDTRDVERPIIVMNGAGNAIAVWRDRDEVALDQKLWASWFVPGQGWGWAELVEANGMAQTHTPRVGMDPTGNAVAVWTADYIGSTSIQGKVLQ